VEGVVSGLVYGQGGEAAYPMTAKKHKGRYKSMSEDSRQPINFSRKTGGAKPTGGEEKHNMSPEILPPTKTVNLPHRAQARVLETMGVLRKRRRRGERREGGIKNGAYLLEV